MRQRGRLAVDRERVRLVALSEVCRYAGRAASVAEYLVKRAMLRGFFFAVSYDRTLVGEKVHVTVTFRLLKSEHDEKTTLKYLRARALTVAKFFEVVKKDLEKEGVRCDLKLHLAEEPGPEAAVASVKAEFSVIDVDLDKVFARRQHLLSIFHGTNVMAGGKRSAFIKQLEAEAGWEVERGAEAGSVEATLGTAPEGSRETAIVDTGLDLVGPREAAERGYLRLHKAALQYGIPLLALFKLAMDGRVRTLHGVDEGGKPAFYVLEEDVREVAKYIKLEREAGRGGEGGG